MFELKGIWRGEYVYDDRFQPSVVKTSIPFILKITSIETNGLFQGMCQDDPTISKIDFPASIYGKFEGDQLIFNKSYPKTIFQDNFGKVGSDDQPQPDVIYHAKLSDKAKIFGSWRMERTFRKLGDRVMEFGPMDGVWWMERL
jgi:hypothetical protein